MMLGRESSTPGRVHQVVPRVQISAHSIPTCPARQGGRGPQQDADSVSSTAVRCHGPPTPPPPVADCQTPAGEACQRQRAPAAGRGGEAPQGWPDRQMPGQMWGPDLPGSMPAPCWGPEPALASPMAGEALPGLSAAHQAGAWAGAMPQLCPDMFALMARQAFFGPGGGTECPHHATPAAPARPLTVLLLLLTHRC